MNKRIPPIFLAALIGTLFGLSLARLLGNGLMLAAFNGPVLVSLFVLFCAVCFAGIAFWLLDQEFSAFRIFAVIAPVGLSAVVDLLLPGPGLLRTGVLLSGGIIIAGIGQLKNRRAGVLLAALLPLGVYLFDISPYVGRADTFEFQVVAPTLGIAHPSGYPLYILIGKLFSWLPFSSVAWRVNFSSAVFAALVCGMVFWVLSDDELREQFGMQSYGIPVLVAWVWGFSPTLWARSIEAEVYALNAFIVTLAMYLAQRWLRDDEHPDRWMLGYALLTGVAMASHITLGAIALLAGIIIFTRKPLPRIRIWLYAALLGIAGLCLYLYIPLRWPALNGGQWMSPRQFIDFVTNAESGGALHPLAFYQDPVRWRLVWRLFLQQFSVAGMLLAFIGWGTWMRNQWRFALGSLLMALAWVWFNLGFYVADPDYSAFLIPAHVVVSVWLGYGVLSIMHWLKRWREWLLPVVLIALMLLPASHIWDVAPTLDTISLGRQDELWARYVLGLPIKQNAAILADSEKFPPLYYLQQVEGVRPDLELVTLFNEEQYRADMQQRLNAGQSVYMARYLPGLDIYGVQSLGPLVEVGGHQDSHDAKSLVEFQPAGLRFMDYTLEADPYNRALSHLTLIWQTSQAVKQDLEVHLRLLDGTSGDVVWIYTPHRPVSAYSATNTWLEDQRISDYYALTWPEWLPDNPYSLEIALFERFSEDAQTFADGRTWFPLEEITPPEHPSTMRDGLRYRFGDDTVLVEAEIPGEVFADSNINIDLRWQCPPASSQPGRALLVWKLEGETLMEQPLLPDTGASTCDRDALQRYRVIVPSTPGGYTLAIRWEDAQAQGVPARCSWLAHASSACLIADVNVGPSASGLANYQNDILLVDADFDAEDVPAGGMLRVNLEWRGLRSMDADYTVFLQVIAPDGQIAGQVDSWPVQGARPTSSWQPGETLTDQYAFFLKDELPSGEYEIIVGWYLLADMRRLSVYSVDSRPMSDYTSIGSFSIP